MKKILSVLLVAVMILGLMTLAASCKPKEKGPEIAMVTDVGNIDDKSFNESTWVGVKGFADSKGLTSAYYRPSEDSTAAREEAIKTAIDKGAKVVVTPGWMFGDAIYNVQDKYPNVQFLILDAAPAPADDSTAVKISPNVYSIIYKEEQSGFLAGYAAVMDGYTKLGFCGGMAVPAVVRFGYGFVQGAEAAAAEKGLEKGAIQINYWYANSFAPSDDIRTKMDGWYTGGTEVVFACGGGIYLSVVAAAEAADGKVIGVDVDQSSVSPTVITSAFKDLANSVKMSLTKLYDNKGKWPTGMAGVSSTLGAAEKCTGIPTAEGSWRFNTFTVEQYQAVLDKIINGDIAINDSSEATNTPEVVIVNVDYQG
jgi:basic membrane protein A